MKLGDALMATILKFNFLGDLRENPVFIIRIIFPGKVTTSVVSYILMTEKIAYKKWNELYAKLIVYM